MCNMFRFKKVVVRLTKQRAHNCGYDSTPCKEKKPQNYHPPSTPSYCFQVPARFLRQTIRKNWPFKKKKIQVFNRKPAGSILLIQNFTFANDFTYMQ